MQHNDRQMLVTGIGEIVDEIVRQGTGGQVQELLRRRLDPLLDAFLLESQPIVGAEVTILLADIRGFTALTQSLPPRELIDLLNRFFSRMCEVIKRHGGVIDKFIGDAVMGVFGVPVFRQDHVERAVRAALHMQATLHKESRHGNPLLSAIGISIHTGIVVAGNVGSQTKMEYTVIGDSVNITARLNALAAAGEVVVSQQVNDVIKANVATESIGLRAIKGKTEPVEVYKVLEKQPIDPDATN